MTVSLIVPVYNAEPWLGECMAHISAQTYKDMEIVVVNDGSTDGSNALIGRSDTRVSVSTTVHRGAAAARNTGIEVSTGDYIAFCDADDYLADDALEKMVNAMDGVDMVCGSFRKFGEFGQIVRHEHEVMFRGEVADYAMGNLVSPRRNQMLSGCWAKMYRRELVTTFPPLTTAEDMAFNFDYLKRCEKVRFLDDIVYHNRKRKGSLSTTFDEGDKPGLFGFLQALRYARTFLEEFFGDEEIEDALDSSKVYHSMLYFTRIMQQTGDTPRDALMRLYA
jgi:glycosyltransferase involved in cell wall biosynthesis